MPISVFTYSDHSKIVSSSPSKEKKPVEPFLEAPEQVFLLSTLIYIKENLQQITKTMLKFYSFAIIVPAFKKTCKRLLKARTSDVYQNRSYIKCYNFCQQYKNRFATA